MEAFYEGIQNVRYLLRDNWHRERQGRDLVVVTTYRRVYTYDVLGPLLKQWGQLTPAMKAVVTRRVNEGRVDLDSRRILEAIRKGDTLASVPHGKRYSHGPMALQNKYVDIF
jgi:hypothetical protein